ncbi:MAG: hypothetical protein VKL59_14510 [Nostocaceae cyanobacterium]|nr:hypothetical protein [Nostocaceae cyanobacterium]
MLQSIEGIYKNGEIKLAELPLHVSESIVIVTFLEPKTTAKQKRMMEFGMFSGSQQSTEADFEMAEFHGDSEDGLDWG